MTVTLTTLYLGNNVTKLTFYNEDGAIYNKSLVMTAD